MLFFAPNLPWSVITDYPIGLDTNGNE